MASSEPQQSFSSYHIPNVIWQPFEAEIRKESKKFLENIANALKVPTEDLRKLVLPTNDSLRLILYETEDLKECKAFIKHPTKPHFAIRCRKITFPGDDCCSEHKHSRSSVQSTIIPPTILRPLKVPAELPPLWLTEDKKVVNIDGTVCGHFNSDTNELVFFDLYTELRSGEDGLPE